MDVVLRDAQRASFSGFPVVDPDGSMVGAPPFGL